MKILPLLALLGLMSPLSAQPARPPALPSEARQFDFWLGDWEVTSPDGKTAGTSRIERVAGGAGLLENWSGAGGFMGKSLNTYQAEKKAWRQFWVGSDGGVLELAGGIVQGRMVLAGEQAGPGGRIAQRITWTPNAGGTVRQLWEQSSDGGKTWTTVFDGLYRPRKTG